MNELRKHDEYSGLSAEPLWTVYVFCIIDCGALHAADPESWTVYAFCIIDCGALHAADPE